MKEWKEEILTIEIIFEPSESEVESKNVKTTESATESENDDEEN